jgi:hypothetical protein
MKFIYLGSEVPSNRKILEAMGTREVGFSYWRAAKRGLPKSKDYLLSNYFNPFMNITVYPGIPAAVQLTEREIEDFCADYEDFIANNIDRIHQFVEVDHSSISEQFVQEQRKGAWDEIDKDKFIAVFRAPYDDVKLEWFASTYKNILIPKERLIESASFTQRMKAAIRAHGTSFHTAAMADPSELKTVPLESMSTLSWLSPMMHGETIVWDGAALVRYPKNMKEQARPRCKVAAEAADLDFNKIMADDNIEVCKLALWSYEQLEAKMGQELSYNSEKPLGEGLVETTLSDVDKKEEKSGKLIPRKPSEMLTLPVLGLEYKTVIEPDEEGRDVISERQLITSSPNSLRMCNTCFLSSKCPAFKLDSACSFNLPLELKTKDQMRSFINAIIEMQGQRVAFARFSEEIMGGYPDPNLSQEIDRLFKIIKTVKELDDSREFIRMTVERSGGAGVLSSIFGEKATQNLRELPGGGYDADATDALIQDITEE